MKSTYNYIVILLSVLLVSTTSCLKEEIKDTPNPALIKNSNDVDALLMGLYARFNDGSAFKYEGVTMYLLAGDDIYSEGGSIFGTYSKKEFTDSHTGPMWSSLHATVASANEVIATLGRLELDSAFESRAMGEAQFIRAFSYYYLVRLYGGVPIRTEAVNINSNFYLPRNSVDEVYAQIVTDLKSASERLQEYNKLQGGKLGRASKGAAQAILAQAYLTYGNQKALKGQDATAEYQNAVLYADSVINSGEYKLISNYADLFDINKETSAYDEVIFGVRFQVDQQNRAIPAAGSEFALHFAHDNTDYVTGNGARGNGDANYRIMPWIYEHYRTGDYVTGTTTKTYDYRTEASFFPQGFNSNLNKNYAIYPNVTPNNKWGTINSPMCSKYKDPNGKDMRNHGNDLFIIRLAEVYLIKAEALNELEGPSANALAAFNKVRERARGANGTARTVPANLAATGLTRDAFRMKIFDERGLELLAEGQRWFDLVRMRSPLSASQTMYEYQFKVRLSDPTRYAQELPQYDANQRRWERENGNPISNAVYPEALRVQVPKHLLFPIPYSEMTNNPSFAGQQNPGW